MEVHKPQPWHGWREFLKEYLIIVVGVLTALAAEQAAEWAHNRADLIETREALRAEVRMDAQYVRYGEQEDRCYLKVLDLYEAWADGGPKPSVPPLDVPFPDDSVWETAKNGSVAHMPLEEKLAYARFYFRVRTLAVYAAQQRTQQGGAVRGYMALKELTPDEARDLKRELGAYRTLLRAKLGAERGLVQSAKGLGVVLPQKLGEASDVFAAPDTQNLDALCALARTPVAPIS